VGGEEVPESREAVLMRSTGRPHPESWHCDANVMFYWNSDLPCGRSSLIGPTQVPKALKENGQRREQWPGLISKRR
jgi:hypothetical protein